MLRISPSLGLLLLALVTGCGDPPGADPRDGDRAEAGVDVPVWFMRGEEPEAVLRRVPAADPLSALRALVLGPTPEERQAGLTSWFSDSTADALRDVDLRDGFLIVDFDGLDRLIPNASSSLGSRLLLTSLDSTVLQFPEVDSVEYRLNGSCDAFGEWLQRGCEEVRRP